MQGLWGLSGMNPLQDCNDSSAFFGAGTYAASIMAGRTVGVAKIATVWSGVRFGIGVCMQGFAGGAGKLPVGWQDR